MPAKKKPKSEPTFEESLVELEEIVHAMEEDQLPLEKLISHYERGAELHKKCEEILLSAKKRLETIAKGKETISEPPTSTIDDDDIQLF